MAGWYTWRGGIKVNCAVTKSSLEFFLKGGRSVFFGVTLVVIMGEIPRGFTRGGMLICGSIEIKRALGSFPEKMPFF